MKKGLYLTFLILSLLAALVNGFAIVNTMVSIKYETNNPSDCISNVTGIDLCAQLDKSKLLTVIFSIVFIMLLSKKRWIVKQN